MPSILHAYAAVRKGQENVLWKLIAEQVQESTNVDISSGAIKKAVVAFERGNPPSRRGCRQKVHTKLQYSKPEHDLLAACDSITDTSDASPESRKSKGKGKRMSNVTGKGQTPRKRRKIVKQNL